MRIALFELPEAAEDHGTSEMQPRRGVRMAYFKRGGFNAEVSTYAPLAFAPTAGMSSITKAASSRNLTVLEASPNVFRQLEFRRRSVLDDLYKRAEE
jgi:hypothetical protein